MTNASASLADGESYDDYVGENDLKVNVKLFLVSRYQDYQPEAEFTKGYFVIKISINDKCICIFGRA